MSGSAKPSDLHVPAHPVRFVTAAALFDGHDAAINIMRRILQAQGAEVVHLGHDRSVREVVDAVLEAAAAASAAWSGSGRRPACRQVIVRASARRSPASTASSGAGSAARSTSHSRISSLIMPGRPSR